MRRKDHLHWFRYSSIRPIELENHSFSQTIFIWSNLCLNEQTQRLNDLFASVFFSPLDIVYQTIQISSSHWHSIDRKKENLFIRRFRVSIDRFHRYRRRKREKKKKKNGSAWLSISIFFSNLSQTSVNKEFTSRHLIMTTDDARHSSARATSVLNACFAFFSSISSTMVTFVLSDRTSFLNEPWSTDVSHCRKQCLSMYCWSGQFNHSISKGVRSLRWWWWCDFRSLLRCFHQSREWKQWWVGEN